MEYSIYKDSKVEDTVNRILNILNSVEAELDESLYEYSMHSEKMPYSLRVTLFGEEVLGTNGKGATLANARASAYSEFMERLQNNRIPRFNILNDKFFIAPDEILDDSLDDELLSKYYSRDVIKYLKKLVSIDYNNVKVPFLNIKDKQICYINPKILWNIQAASGMCAGNTPWEAIVQGLSEIYERHTMCRVLLEDISMPDIPEEIWSKYETIVGLKNYIEQYGYNIYIKDASLGDKLPVVCTLFEDKQKGLFSFKFGAQPSLPIAIERTLTEFAQGGVKNLEINGLQYDYPDNYIDKVYLIASCDKGAPVIKKSQDEVLFEHLFNRKSNYEFDRESWVNEDTCYTNNDLLKFLINKSYLNNRDIYVRDVSYLDFPAYFIYIPGVSELHYIDAKKKELEYNFAIWINYKRDWIDSHNDIDSLIKALDFKNNYKDYCYKDVSISNLLNDYLYLLCYIVKNDIENIFSYCDKIIFSGKINADKTRIKIIKEIFIHKNKEEQREDIINNISVNYPRPLVENMFVFVENMTFDKIKQLIRSNNIMRENNKFLNEETSRINNKNNDKRRKYGDVDARIDIVRQNLINKYTNNIPDQNNLLNIFDFV